MTYSEFLHNRVKAKQHTGFSPLFMPDHTLFDFQSDLVTWALFRGRAAIFADCGLGKSFMEITFAQNVMLKTNKPVLLLTPIAVGAQMIGEANKLNVEAKICRDGKVNGSHIVISNYERLHLFNPHDFGGIVCDESSILKNYSGATRKQVTEFCQHIQYRLLATATAAPNDYMELGTSAEALGVCRRVEMLATYFVHNSGDTGKWRLKKHSDKAAFWKWICTWARCVRKPSDLGFNDDGYNLPKLTMHQHVVGPERELAIGLSAQRAERRNTLEMRCEQVRYMADHDYPVLSFCHLNVEGDLLAKIIPGAIQVSGLDKEEAKEEKFKAFISGQIRVLVTKPRIAGFGLNFQHCAHQTYFPSHSYEELYQSVRRSWRFGQKENVDVDIITTHGEANVLSNLQRKIDISAKMFSKMVALMNDPENQKQISLHNNPITTPTWLA